MLIDTHAHLNFSAFEDDLDSVLKNTLDLDMGFIMPGTQFETSKTGVELAQKWNNPRVWAAVGLHPIHLEKREADSSEIKLLEEFYSENFDRAKYEELAKSKKVVAIGEIGLDYWYRPKTKEAGSSYAQKQIETLRAQLNMATDLKKPVILHCRVAHKDLLKLLAEHPHTQKMENPGVVHSYTGSTKQLKKFLQMGYHIGINGLIFKLELMADAAKEVPLDKMVLETDSPYLAPPEVGEGRNEPANIKYTAQKIADIKGISFEEVAKQTTQNAKRVFGVDFKA